MLRASTLIILILALSFAAPAWAQGAKGAAPEKPKKRYEVLPGMDMTVMTGEEKKKLVDRMNAEKCTCGCKDESIAACLSNDPSCPFAVPLTRLAATEVSPNYRKMVTEVDIANWTTYRNPPEHMKLHFDYLKGFDLDQLSLQQQERVLVKANTLMCDCGCVGDTLAKCVNTDPTCTVAPAKIHELIEEVKKTAYIEPVPQKGK